MANYQEKIEGLIGISAPIVPTSSYTEFLVNGAQEIINLVPKDVLWTMSSQSTIQGGSVTSITITVQADDASVVPTLTFSAPQHANGVTATATCTVDSNTIETTTITNAGSGYTSPPTITLSSSNATLSAVINDGSLAIGTNTILSVVRQTDNYTLDVNSDNTNETTSVVECREIESSQRGRVAPGSGWLEEVNEEDPVYYKLQGKIYILPNGTGFVDFVTPPAIAFDTAATAMPSEVDYLVILFASIKSLNVHIRNVNIPTVNSSSFTNETLASIMNGPDFTSINSNFAIALTDYPSVPDDTFTQSGSYVDFSATPSYTGPSPAIDLTTELAALQSYITDEDLDLAGATGQKIQLILQEYQAEQQNSTQQLAASQANAQNLLQEAIQEKGIQMTAEEKEKNLQLIMVKSKLERRIQATQELMNTHASKIQMVSTILQEFQAKMGLFESTKKSKQEQQVSLMNSYNAGIQALLTRYKGESRQVQPQELQEGGRR